MPPNYKDTVLIYENPHYSFFAEDSQSPRFYMIHFPMIRHNPDVEQVETIYPCGCPVAIDLEYYLTIGKPPVDFYKDYSTKEVSVHCPFCHKKIG